MIGHCCSEFGRFQTVRGVLFWLLPITEMGVSTRHIILMLQNCLFFGGVSVCTFLSPCLRVVVRLSVALCLSPLKCLGCLRVRVSRLFYRVVLCCIVSCCLSAAVCMFLYLWVQITVSFVFLFKKVSGCTCPLLFRVGLFGVCSFGTPI